MQHRIGVLHGQEETFPPALIQEINARQSGFQAESASIGGIWPSLEPDYAVLVDRISQRVPFYRSYLKQQALLGTHCVHDPYWLECVDRSVMGQLAAAAGVEALPAVVLPSKDHPPGVTSEDLSNLVYPLPWEEILELVSLPARLRPLGLGLSPTTRVTCLGDLWQGYASGGDQLVVLEAVPEAQASLLCLQAGEQSAVMGHHGMVDEPAVAEMAARFCELADLPLVGLEFARYQGRYVLSDLQLFPSLDWWSLSEQAFSRVVGSFADYVLELARRPHAPRYPGIKSASAKPAKSGRKP